MYEKPYEKDGRHIMGYLVEQDKANRSAIIIIAADTQEEAERKLANAISDSPPQYAKMIAAKGISN